mgnify:FL=1
MKKDISELKKIVFNNIDQANHKPESNDEKLSAFNKLEDEYDTIINNESAITIHPKTSNSSNEPIEDTEIIEESLSLHRKEEDMIRKALEKHNRKRKNAAKDLGISERTLYRKIKEYGIE